MGSRTDPPTPGSPEEVLPGGGLVGADEDPLRVADGGVHLLDRGRDAGIAAANRQSLSSPPFAKRRRDRSDMFAPRKPLKSVNQPPRAACWSSVSLLVNVKMRGGESGTSGSVEPWRPE